MLRAQVGMGRTIVRGGHQWTYSVHLEGEILATPDDPEAVVGRVRELQGLAEEALQNQIDHHTHLEMLAEDEGGPPPGWPSRHEHPAPLHAPPPAADATPGPAPTPGEGPDVADVIDRVVEPATEKQRRRLEEIATRQGLAADEFDARITAILETKGAPRDLTKRDAARAIVAPDRDASAGSRVTPESGTGRGQRRRLPRRRAGSLEIGGP